MSTGTYVAKQLLSLALAALLAAGAQAADRSEPDQARAWLPDGMYLVLKEAATRDKLGASGGGQQALINDGRFLEAAERNATTYVLVSERQSIPFSMASAPDRGKDGKGRSKLMLALSPDQAGPLEKFTRKNCGRTVAIVIGGDVVTTHKIREPITGGRVQITRCSDSGCDVLFSKLQDKSR